MSCFLSCVALLNIFTPAELPPNNVACGSNQELRAKHKQFNKKVEFITEKHEEESDEKAVCNAIQTKMNVNDLI